MRSKTLPDVGALPEPVLPAGKSGAPLSDGARPGTVYHLLGDIEIFSNDRGGAISRWAGEVLAGDTRAVIVCPLADDSWGFPRDRVLVLESLRRFAPRSKRLRYRFATPLRLLLLRNVFTELLGRVREGDVLYIHNRPDFAVALGRVARKHGVSLVLHMHNSHLRRYPDRFCRRIRVDLLAFCSNYLRKEASGRPVRAAHAVVIPNGADPACFYPAPALTEIRRHGAQAAAPPQIFFAGRIVEEKGVHIFLGALRLLAERGIAAQGRILGGLAWGDARSSEYMERLRRDAPPNVTFLPQKKGATLGEEFRNADIFCCPSIWNEPFGMVNVEAMATAVPVVASRVGGIPEIFAEGGAILVEPNDVEKLADALTLLIQDPGLRARTGAQGYAAFLRHYQWSSVRSIYYGAIALLPKHEGRER